MSESQPESPGRHAAPDDDPAGDPPPAAGSGGDHRAGPAEDEGHDEADPRQGPGENSETGVGNTRQPGADPEDEREIEEERERRLDPDNRPENVEVDNSERDFDAEKGLFTDSEGYEEAEETFPPLGGQGA
jgi:hypothetical protein